MTTEKDEKPLHNLLINIVIPAIILMKGAKLTGLSPAIILVIALILPLIYGLYSILIKKKNNIISIIGFFSILITGIIGVMQLPAEYIAYKEASIPFIVGIVIFISGFTKFPIASKLLYNKEIFNIERIEQTITKQQQEKLEKTVRRASFFLFLSFMLSAILNFILAKVFIKSASGTPEFNEELGQMTLYSYPVIVIPSLLIMILIFWNLYSTIKKLSGLSNEEMLLMK